MSPLQEAKLAIMAATGLGKDALHIYIGLLVMLSVAALFRLPLRDWRPLAAVLAVALAGEIWDLLDTRAQGRASLLARNWHDVWNTLFWPAVLFLLARRTRLLKR
jgi:hypothetical protein